MSFPENDHTNTRILIIDFNADHRTCLKGILSDPSYSIIEVPAYEDMWNVMKDNDRIDLIITNVNVPGYTADDYVSLLKRHCPDVPVILITTKKKMEAFRECAELGGDDYITVPLDSKNVANVVSRVVELNRQNALFESGGMHSQSSDKFAGYEIIELLGKGAMGAVYQVQKVERGVTSQYALKVLHPMTNQNESQVREVLERFLREAETASKLRHPNILQIIDYGLAEDELQPFIVMELIKGHSLRHYINGDIIIGFLEKVRILRQVAEALYAIHCIELYHRDVKPENIMVGQELDVKVTDFGFVRLPNSDLTQTLKVVGTPFYMAPEAYTSSKVDERADIFSFGVVAYELLLNRKPFMANSFSRLRTAIQTARPLGPRKIDPSFPTELQNILAKTLKKEPKARYESAAEIAADLSEFLKKISKPPETTVAKISKDDLIKSAVDMRAEIAMEYRRNTDWS